MSHLTVAYFTSRKEPKFEWFFDSLDRQTGGNYLNIKMVIVDRWAQQRVFFGCGVTSANALENGIQNVSAGAGRFAHVEPKPCVWQGEHRLTKEDWFAASNARNTALCLAPDGHIAFVDDLSVLLPGWLNAVSEAMAGNDIVCGAYRKVKDMVVEDGKLISFTDHPQGVDVRWPHGRDDASVPCQGNWLFGCSLVAPVQAFLDIGGWPEALCDGLGSEDSIAGIMLAKKGYKFRYDRRMCTYESEELHAQLPIMRRSDYGVSPRDKSHKVLEIAHAGNGWHPNYFGEEGIVGLRQRVLAGAEFPIVQVPEHEWYASTPLCDL